MLRRKIIRVITHTLSIITLVIISVFMNSTAGYAWSVITIDFETHNDNTNLALGSYSDDGAWKWRYWPTCNNTGYRYTSVEVNPLRHGIAFWRVQIPKTGFYKIETSYFATENRTSDADYAVYVNTTTTAATNKTAKPVFATTINQIGENVTWKTLGTYCLKKNDISMIVLDNNDDSGSASTDASRWTYMGEEYSSKICGGESKIVPIIDMLLLK